uniref:Secreted protein n=1 Tax=Achlya hypogyna TaxID=1202772 RepID=A0A0A7CP01_ACHHY|nr:secreted protein [Achlya hypogyna]
MVRLAPTLATLASAAAATVLSPGDDWHVTPVRGIQARVQAGVPVYDEQMQTWVAPFGNTFEERHRAVMDTVNTASVEGALMYVQAEGINAKTNPLCRRKNNMAYVWFMEVHIANSKATIAEFENNWGIAPEFCSFAALDGGMCTPYNRAGALPQICYEYNGAHGQPNLGPCVGGEPRTSDPRAPYRDNIWFSFPNSCFTKRFPQKTADCRQQIKGGLCPYGTLPDGVSCTYSHRVLGYVSLDDLVGITSMVSNKTGRPYANKREFCLDGNVEQLGDYTIPFWNNPTDPDANAARAQALIDFYQNVSAVCEPCTPDQPGCQVKPPGYSIPELLKACRGAECKVSPWETRPPTEAPTTDVPTTEAPTTEAPTTHAPTTESPTTTDAPTTTAVPVTTEVAAIKVSTQEKASGGARAALGLAVLAVAGHVLV